MSELLELDMDQKKFSFIQTLLCRFSIIWTWVLCHHQIFLLLLYRISALLNPNKHTFADTHVQAHIHTCAQTHTVCCWFEQSSQFLLPFILCVERKMKKKSSSSAVIIERITKWDMLFSVTATVNISDQERAKLRETIVTCMDWDPSKARKGICTLGLGL